MGLGTTGPGPNSFVGSCLKFFVNQEGSSSSFSLKLSCLKVVLFIFPLKPRIQGRCDNSFVGV